METNIYKTTKDYINSVSNGYCFYRKRLITHLRNIYGNNFAESYVDSIRNMLEKSGYVSKFIESHPKRNDQFKYGCYVKLKHIPESLSLKDLRREYNENLSTYYSKNKGIYLSNNN